jgi:hypothetical protein
METGLDLEFVFCSQDGFDLGNRQCTGPIALVIFSGGES